VVMLKNSPRERINLAKECWFPAKAVPCLGCGLYAATDGPVPHGAMATMLPNKASNTSTDITIKPQVFKGLQIFSFFFIVVVS
jgi:hypothetical protein